MRDTPENSDNYYGVYGKNVARVAHGPGHMYLSKLTRQWYEGEEEADWLVLCYKRDAIHYWPYEQWLANPDLKVFITEAEKLFFDWWIEASKEEDNFANEDYLNGRRFELESWVARLTEEEDIAIEDKYLL